MKNIFTRKNLCVLGSIMILLGVFMPFAIHTAPLPGNMVAASTVFTRTLGPWLAGVSAAALVFSALAWYIPAIGMGIASLVMFLQTFIGRLITNAEIAASKTPLLGIVESFAAGFWFILAGSVILTVFSIAGLIETNRKKKEGALPGIQLKSILCRKNLCVLSGLVITFSFFLPFLVFGQIRMYSGYALHQFRLGFLFIIFGLAAVICSAFEKYIPALSAGVASAALFLYDFFCGLRLSVPAVLEKTQYMYCGLGCFTLPIAAAALIVFSVWGIIEKKKKLQASVEEELIP